VSSRLIYVERLRWNKTALFESRCGFQKMRFYSSTATPQKMTGRSQKWSFPFNKKPRSAPGFIVRVQQSRSGFRQMGLYFSTAVAALLHCGLRLFC
jgi:hypothetical protein